ncbi:MAG: XRE family transcriptional regulator [Olegusella sp.]|nr:XRE family transcriptional regulator [Olegusella sp.]
MDNKDQPLTEELLARLLEASSPEAYLSDAQPDLEDRDLAAYASSLLEEHGIKRSQVIEASGLNPTYTYQIFQGTRRPGRDHAIMLAFGLRCTLREAQRLLRLAGTSELWSRKRRDAIIIYCLQHGMTRAACDDELWRLGEPTLLAVGA